jgi:hypothetical protein
MPGELAPSATTNRLHQVLLSLLSPEAQLLFLSASDSATDSDIRQLLKRKLDWAELCRLADREKAAPLVWHRIETAAPGEIPRGAEAHLRKLARVVSFHMSYLEQLVIRTTGCLDRSGIDYTLLKGAALACAVYGSFDNRPMIDVDVLVREDDANAAVDALLSAGWVEQAIKEQRDDIANRYHLQALVDRNGLVSAEVHISPLPYTAPFGITTEAVLSSAKVIPFRDSVVRVPDPLYLLLHACLHFAWSTMFRMGAWRTFRDVKTLISSYDLDWDGFVELARSHRAETCCFWALHLARELIGARVPDEILQALRPPLPAPVLRTLERHFTLILLPSTTSCPSVRLRRVMWAAGILPRRSGHGASRPGAGRDLRPEVRLALARRWDVRGAAKLRRSPRVWARYWGSVLLAARA